MIPKVRWLQERRDVRAEQVRAYADKYEVSMREAKSILQPHTEPRLQYFDDEVQEWIDVPFELVLVPHE